MCITELSDLREEFSSRELFLFLLFMVEAGMNLRRPSVGIPFVESS